MHPILTCPGDIKTTGKEGSNKARNQRPNVAGVLANFHIYCDDISLGDMRGDKWRESVTPEHIIVDSPFAVMRHSEVYSKEHRRQEM